MARYEIWLTGDTGARICSLNNILSAEFWQVANGVGPCSVMLPSTFDTSLLARDRMIQCWRAPRGGSLSLWRAYFIRYWRFSRQGSRLAIEVIGRDTNHLLSRRIVAAFSGTANAQATATEADDLMKDIVTDMISDAISPVPSEGTRVWSDLSIQGDLTAGPQLTMGYAYDNVLEVLQALNQASRTAGTEVFFDIVPTDLAVPIQYEFRTYTGQLGTDLTGSNAIFDEARGNLSAASIAYDYRDEITYAYGLGQGEGTNREVQQVAASDRYLLSTWNRIEAAAYAADQSTANGVRERARDKLTAGEPKTPFSAELLVTDGFKFGTHWGHGDKITARFLEQQYDTIIRRTGILLSPGQERISAQVALTE